MKTQTLDELFEAALQRIEPHCSNDYSQTARARNGQTTSINSTVAFQLFRNMADVEKLMFGEVLRMIVARTPPRDMETTIVNVAVSYVEHFCHVVAENSLN